MTMKKCGWYNFNVYKSAGNSIYKIVGINGNKCKLAIENYKSLVSAVTQDSTVLKIWEYWSNIWNVLNIEGNVSQEQV